MYLPKPILSSQQAQDLDQCLIEQHGWTTFDLMLKAGHCAAMALAERWPNSNRVLVFCGSGNNGGDGYVVAEKMMIMGQQAVVVQLSKPKTIAAKKACTQFKNAGGKVLDSSELDDLAPGDVVVDAMLGIGISRDVGGCYADIINKINQSSAPVLALDIPSGLGADSGYPKGLAIEAVATATFITYKMGLLSGVAKDYVGEVILENLDIPPKIIAQQNYGLHLVDPAELSLHIKRRAADVHKALAGRVLIVGGNESMQGAASMAAAAAFRTGAGLVSVASIDGGLSRFPHMLPEVRVFGSADAGALRKLLIRADAVGIGPGLGQDQWAHQMWETALKSDRKLVVDADALNLLAKNRQKRDDWILTPHPGEAGRLLGISSADVQSSRLEAAVKIAETYGGVCVLKGSSTLIVSDGEGWLSKFGNAGMATGGMGDILTGVIAAVAAQRLSPQLAARTGVYIHGKSGDLAAAKGGPVGMIASELLPYLRETVNELQPLSKADVNRFAYLKQSD